MKGEKTYVVRYWEDGIGKRSKVQDFVIKKQALDFAREKGLEGLFYVVYESVAILTNLDD
jgi:hypothetical protein